MNTSTSTYPSERVNKLLQKESKVGIHILLFLLTLLTTTVMGVLWQNDADLANISKGLTYSLSLLFILSCHEFGHYFAAKYHKVKTTLPYYIPMPPITGIGFGTMGAVIRMREAIPTKKALFDIGIAGPISGFIASILVLLWGFSHLPGKEFLLAIHPDYNFITGSSPNVPPGASLTFGSTLLYDFFSKVIPQAGIYVPPMNEMYHYPFLITGWFGLFVTAMNLLPIGQLDGGHIAYAMFGRKHSLIARVTTFVVTFSGLMSLVPLIFSLAGLDTLLKNFFEIFPHWNEWFWFGWFVWALIIFFVIKIDHPPIQSHDSLSSGFEMEEQLSSGRILFGWFAACMFIVSITPAPFILL